MFDVAIKPCGNLTRTSLDNSAHDRSMAHFHCSGLMIYSAFQKLAARLLRYRVSWKLSFLFASIMMVGIIVDHVLVFQPSRGDKDRSGRGAAGRSCNFW